MTGPATYEIRVRGHLDDHWSDRLCGLAITRNADGTTTLSGLLADQSELYGVLAGLRDIGAALLSVMLAVPCRRRRRRRIVGTGTRAGW